MDTATVLTRSSLPATSNPHHYRSLVADVAEINAVLEISGLSDDDKTRLLRSVAGLTKTCVADTRERYTD